MIFRPYFVHAGRVESNADATALAWIATLCSSNPCLLCVCRHKAEAFSSDEMLVCGIYYLYCVCNRQKEQKHQPDEIIPSTTSGLRQWSTTRRSAFCPKVRVQNWQFNLNGFLQVVNDKWFWKSNKRHFGNPEVITWILIPSCHPNFTICFAFLHV